VSAIKLVSLSGFHRIQRLVKREEKVRKGGMASTSIGGYRDRSTAFFKFRNASQQQHADAGSRAQAGEEGEHALLRERGDVDAESSPQWVAASEKAQELMTSIREKMAELKRRHERALLPNFGSSPQEEQHIDVLTKDITRLFRNADNTLQQLSTNEQDTHGRVQNNVQRAVASDLQKLSIEFRKQQKEYLRKLRAQREDELGTIDFASDFNSQSKSFVDDEKRDPGFSQAQLLQVEQAESVSRERDEEVQNVVDSVNELAQVMKDLSVLVVDQGTVLDRIDYNCEQVAASVERGEKQLKEAESTQKQSRMLIIIFCLLMAVFVMLVIVIFRFAT
jgi:syntaxin 16